MSGQSVNAVIGGDWANPLPVTTYGPPRPKPKGLDWSKHRAPEPEPVPVVEQPEASVTEIRARVSKPRREPKRCACGAEISAAATRCRSCNAQQLASSARARGPRTWVTRTSIVDVPTARAEYEAGATCPEIADRHNWPVVSVRRQLIKAGVQMRDDRAGRTRAKKSYDPELVAAVRSLYVDQGLSQLRVAEALGTTVKVIQNVMSRHGIPARQGQSGSGDTLGDYRARLEALGVTARHIRLWAAASGYRVNHQGLMSLDILSAYEAAHPSRSNA